MEGVYESAQRTFIVRGLVHDASMYQHQGAWPVKKGDQHIRERHLNTANWQEAHIPAGVGSQTYSSSLGVGSSGSNWVKLVDTSSVLGLRTNRLYTLLPLWLPGIKYMQPFSGVQFSRANQKPTAEGGCVYRKVESMCAGTYDENDIDEHGLHQDRRGFLLWLTSPPILGCLQITMDCNILGSWPGCGRGACLRRGSERHTCKSIVHYSHTHFVTEWFSNSSNARVKAKVLE